MKTIIYYFSGTGNSLHLAIELSRRLPDCQVVSIAKVLNQSSVMPEAESVGIVSPVYFWGLPSIVAEFAKKADFSKAGYRFAVLTSGGMAGRAMTYLRDIFRQNSSDLEAGFKVAMPGNYIPMYNTPDTQAQQKILKKAASKIEKIVPLVKAQKSSMEKDNILFKLISPIIYNRWLKSVHQRDRKFHIGENCNSCGICELVCPVNNIEMVDQKPHWLHRCEQCFACLHFCPEKTIQYGTKTTGRRRYHNPFITVNDIIAQK
jgi:ferredoxin